MELETQRLYLRGPKMKDAAAYTAIHNSEFVQRFNAMACTTVERVEGSFSDPEYQKNTVFLEEKVSGHIIGAIFLEEDSLRWGVSSRGLSYFVGEDYARKGYMKEAMRVLIAYLFATEDLECISARAFAPNAASRALLRSLGFREDGIIPRCVKGYGGVIFDDVIHTLLREDFQ